MERKLATYWVGIQPIKMDSPEYYILVNGENKVDAENTASRMFPDNRIIYVSKAEEGK